MKRIVICCDGTWKRMDAVCPTNVVKLAQAVVPRGRDGVAQVVFHLDGVGTGRGTGALARGIDRAFGGMFGQGLMATLEAAYRFLIFNYAPGDAIYLFGFSRGAFTARSLAGLVRTCGVPARAHTAMIPQALALYEARSADTHPDAEAARQFRARYAVEGPPGRATVEPGTTTIRYLGVWDTVGALGVPEGLAISRGVNRGLRFHDMRLSRTVLAARHAVALDERRRVFPPALWDNLDALNAAAGAGMPYQQRWFPGDHGSVGGGGPVTALSDDAALWIAKGAMQAGLCLDAAFVARLAQACDFRASLRASGNVRRGIADAVLEIGISDRQGPARLCDLAPAALRRWRHDPAYRPAALKGLRSLLDGPAQDPPHRRVGQRAARRPRLQD